MTTVHPEQSTPALTWRELAVLLGERMRHHAYCPTHSRAEADPDNCPFCDDRDAFEAYAAKTARSKS